MAERLNPTPQEAHDNMRWVAQRMSFVQSELVRRLEEGLPAFIDFENQEHGYTSDVEILQPSGYYVAPAVLTDKYINSVCVKVTKTTTPLAPRVFKNEITAIVYSVGEALESPDQVRGQWDRAELIQGYLYHFLTQSEDAQGRSPWAKLEPTGIGELPASLGAYDGAACYFNVVTANQNNNWDVPA